MSSPLPPDSSSAVEPNSPPHRPSFTAPEAERLQPDWEGIAAMAEFKALLARKSRFIVAGTIFFLVYYFALPILVGYFPALMERKIGPVNLAYVFAFSQFVMAWAVAGVYVKTAARWDRAAGEIIQKSEDR